MILLPAIDLYEKKVVRLTRGDYAQMTVYNDDPVAQAKLFQDIKDGKIAIKGWLETAQDSVEDFFTKLCKLGVSTVICTDVSKDGMLAGTNVDLYRQLSQKFSLDLIASGGVSSQEDLTRLKALGLYGAILGKALYTGALDLKTALKEMEG